MNVKCLEVSSCCWFVSLRTGTKVFGFISLIGCILLATLSTWELAIVAKYLPEYKATVVELTADILIQAVQVATSVLLLMGAYQEKSSLLRPWLVMAVVAAVVEVVFLSSLYGQLIGYSGQGGIEWILTTALMLLDDVYGWLVVYSYHQTLTPQGEGIA